MQNTEKTLETWDLRKCSAGPEYSQNQQLPPFESRKEAVNVRNTNRESADCMNKKTRSKQPGGVLKRLMFVKKKKNYSTFTQALCFLLRNNHANGRWQPESGGHWSCAAFVPPTPPPPPLSGCWSYFGLPEAWGQYISTTVYWSVDWQPGGSLAGGICSHRSAQTAHSSAGWEALAPSQFLKGPLSEQQGQLGIEQ